MQQVILHTGASAALADLAHRFWSFRCHEEPLFAIHAGVKPSSPVLFREGHQDYERREAGARVLRQQLEAIPESHVSGQEWATYRLLRRELEDILDFYDAKAHLRPSLFPFGPEYAAVEFVNSVAIATVESAELYVERLQSLPGYFADVIDNLTRGHAAGFRYPRQVLAGAVAAVGAYMDGPLDHSPWLGPFHRTPQTDPAILKIAARAREFIASKLISILQGYANFLAGPLSIGACESIGCRDMHQGDDLYRVLVGHFTTTDLSAREVHEIGRMEVARLTAEMLPVAADAGFGTDLPAYRAYLAEERSFIAPSKDALREEFERLSKRIDRKVPELFGKIPNTTYVIRSIPEATAALLPIAYAQPNTADGSTPGVQWVTSLPFMAPSFVHIPLALHEGWPGHLMHMALIEQMEHLPLFRRYGAAFVGGWRYGACLEGWALYCEGLGIDMGLYQTPHQHFGRLDMEMKRALRLVVDTGIHALGWSRTQAIEYMCTHQAQHVDTIASEVDRYIGMPGQALAYQIGNLKFRELRRRAEQRLGHRFDIRAYHDQLMAAGPVTLPVLERLVADYIENADTLTLSHANT